MVEIPTTEVLMAKLRNLIPELLKRKGMNITELQLKSGLGWPTAHKIATETHIPDRTSIKTLYAVAEALGVKVSDLYEEEK